MLCSCECLLSIKSLHAGTGGAPGKSAARPAAGLRGVLVREPQAYPAPRARQVTGRNDGIACTGAITAGVRASLRPSHQRIYQFMGHMDLPLRRVSKEIRVSPERLAGTIRLTARAHGAAAGECQTSSFSLSRGSFETSVVAARHSHSPALIDG